MQDRKGAGMELIVEGRGTFIGKHQGRLRVTREKKVIAEVPILHLEQEIGRASCRERV